MAYSKKFLSKDIIECPQLGKDEIDKFQKLSLRPQDFYLNYNNYSLLQNPFRRFPYFTATNIDGKLFIKIARNKIFLNGRDNWSYDPRLHEKFQFGKELYSAKKSDFDKGHLTKREYVQWGRNLKIAKEGAISTFFFTNAVPQIDRLNRGVWRRIEDYILHKEVIFSPMKITLFTGPVLSDDDPIFLTKVNGENIQLPYLFWKVVFYIKNNELFRTGFLTSQKSLLENRRIIKSIYRNNQLSKSHFMNFKDAETYQVKVSFIEEITKLTINGAREEFIEKRPKKLILTGIDVRNDNDKYNINMTL